MVKVLYKKILLIICAISIATDSILLVLKLKKHPSPRALVNTCLRKGSLRILSLMKVKPIVTVQQPLNLRPNENYIFMSNHESLVDLPLIFSSVPMSIRMVVKKEVCNLPFFGYAVKNSEFVFIDRANPAQSLQFFAEAKKTLDSGIRLWIFPEGTRSRTGKLLPFKLGGFRLARELGAHIIPVGIVGTRKVLPADTYDLTLGQSIELRIGTPIDIKDYSEGTMQKKLMDHLHTTISDLIR